MATDKCLSDVATKWTTKLFLTKGCAETIPSGESCLPYFTNKDLIFSLLYYVSPVLFVHFCAIQFEGARYFNVSTWYPYSFGIGAARWLLSTIAVTESIFQVAISGEKISARLLGECPTVLSHSALVCFFCFFCFPLLSFKDDA